MIEEELIVYASVKCGDCPAPAALNYINDKLSNTEGRSFKEVDLLLNIKQLLEK